MRTIFKRCVQCPTETPTCVTCPDGQICSLVPQNCNDCAHTECVPNPNPSPKSDRPNVGTGAIAGGVVGGVVFMGVVMFLLWKFWIKKRREQQELEAEEWEEDDIAQQKGDVRRFTAMRSDAASTRTRGSVAASFLSRASNIIQIAYIPGVTNRNRSGHNSLLAQAPVPPIPAAYRNTTPKSPLSNEGDALFFRPGDLRGSTYSDSSLPSTNKRDTQYTRLSITPSLARSSMMSDVYMDDSAPPPMPATQVIRAAPRMVSVKGGSSATSSPSMETSPNLTPIGPKVMMPGQASSNSSLASGTSGFVKAKPVTIGGKGKSRTPVSRQASDASSAPSTTTKPVKSSPLIETSTDSDDDDEHARARKSMIRNSLGQAADPTPLIQPLESPFFDASETQTSASAATQQQRLNPYAAMSSSVGSGRRTLRTGEGRGPGGLSAVIEEAAKRASDTPNQEGTGGKRDQSPFGNEHSIKE